MAEINPSMTDVSEKGDGSALIVTWTDVPEGIACFPARLPNHSVKSIMVFGTFGGGLVEVEGSNDGVNWVSLRYADNAQININGESITALLQHTLLFKPRVVGGVGVKLTMSVFALAPQALRSGG
jgi:hypothetical protein